VTVAGSSPRGRLRLEIAPGRRGAWLARSEATAPLRVQRAFPVGGGEVLAQLVHIGPGVLAGDELELELVVRSGAAAVLVAQSATKVHAMPEGAVATQTIAARVEAGASLEVHAGLVIPFPGASYEQRATLEVEGDGRLVWLERWRTGRPADGVHGRFRRLLGTTTVRVDGRLRYADRFEATGTGTGPVHDGGVLDGHPCLASGVFVGGSEPPPSDGTDGLAVGPFDAALPGSYLRGVGHDAAVLRRGVEAAVAEQRRREGRPSLRLDRYGS
jgi:urease accessory protein